MWVIQANCVQRVQNRKASQQSTNTQSQNVSFFFRVSTATSGPGPPRCRGCTITLNDTHSVGPPWIVISPSQRLPDHTTPQETEVQAPSGIRTRSLSKRAAAHPCLAQCGYTELYSYQHCNRITKLRNWTPLDLQACLNICVEGVFVNRRTDAHIRPFLSFLFVGSPSFR